MLSLKNAAVSSIVCRCLVGVHPKAYLVVGQNKSEKTQYQCVQKTHEGPRCNVIGYICNHENLKCVCCWML